MLYPKDLETKISFDKIRQMLKDNCRGTKGKENIDKISFISNPQLLQKLCLQTMQFVGLMQADTSLPVLQYPEIGNVINKLKIAGAFLELEELADLLKIYKTVVGWLSFLSSQQQEYIELASLAAGIETDVSLIRQIENCIDDQGQLKENASPELKRIRINLKKTEISARKRLDAVMGMASKNDYIPEDSSLTVRNGRLVIPVKAEYKRNLKGFIHDSSASGRILFVEPAEVLELNNDLKELAYQERREIVRILTSLTDVARPYLDDILKGARLLGIIDMIQAKAMFCVKYECTIPDIDQHELNWRRAVNPVLKEILQTQGKHLVPLDVRLNRENRVLVISGPNAGGKSVCLKTVGLLQYIFQCGIPIPVAEGSKSMVFKDIFINIGDDQSIEDDLSTYSSHLNSMDFLIKNTDKHSLFLIDEFGAGTDPQFGGAIAEAILEELANKHGFGLVTTHYNNLKKLAENHEGLVNGRMRFDVKKLQPLYMLETGRPGSSFAIEIASKIGLQHHVIKKAKQKVGVDALQLDRLLNELEKEKKFFEDQNYKLKQQNRLLENTIQNYQQSQLTLDDQKKEILNKAKGEAKQIIKETNQKVENLIREIKENKAAKEQTRQAREDVKEYEKKLQPEKLAPKPSKVEVLGGEIKVGDVVRIKGQNTIGEVIQRNKQSAEIIFGSLKSNIKISRLERVSKRALKKMDTQTPVMRGVDINRRKANFSHDLDIRGKRAEEAMPLVANFIDNAILFGVKDVRIIHGKGDGILRTLVREELKKYKEIHEFRDEHADRGGAGITVAEFN